MSWKTVKSQVYSRNHHSKQTNLKIIQISYFHKTGKEKRRTQGTLTNSPRVQTKEYVLNLNQKQRIKLHQGLKFTQITEATWFHVKKVEFTRKSNPTKNWKVTSFFRSASIQIETTRSVSMLFQNIFHYWRHRERECAFSRGRHPTKLNYIPRMPT